MKWPALILSALLLAAPAVAQEQMGDPSFRPTVLGEAGMLTAQVVRFPADSGREDIVFGLQTPGHDDQQFALNLLHWLSRLEGLR